VKILRVIENEEITNQSIKDKFLQVMSVFMTGLATRGRKQEKRD